MKKLLIVLCISIFITMGCNVDTSPIAGCKTTEYRLLPSEAYDIVELGNGWCSFRLGGNKFIYHGVLGGHGSFESITRIE
jgi:hypothetical protein